MLSGNDRYRSWLPYGFDFLAPHDTLQKMQLETSIRALFSGRGFAEIVPPAFDFAQTFSLTGSRVARQSFQLRGAQGENLSLRTDLTIQVIKAAASGRLGQEPIGRFAYLQPVYHDHPWGVGHQREIFQAGVELLGESPGRFKEILELARAGAELIKADSVFVYGDARFISLLADLFPERERDRLARLFYNKDHVALLNLARQHGVTDEIARMIAEIPLIFGSGSDVLQRLREVCQPLSDLLPILDEASIQENVVFDFSLVRELSYYTGPVFVAYMQGIHSAIITGGIYDNLHAEFGGRERPACGFAINLSAILDQSKGSNV